MSISSSMRLRTFALHTDIPVRKAGQAVGFTSDYQCS